MRSKGSSKEGTGVVERIIAILSLIVTTVAMAVIATMPNETFAKVTNTVSKFNYSTLEEVQKNRGVDPALEASSRVKKDIILPDANEARKERAEIYLAEASLETKTVNTNEKKIINYKTEVVKTAAMKSGNEKVLQKGHEGTRVINKKLTYKGDDLEDIVISEDKIVKKPVNKIVLQGVNSSVPILMVPAKGVYSSYYGERWGRVHKGVDIAANIGEPIKASEGGEVVFSGDKGTYGKCIIVRHISGYETLYAHTSKLIAKTGDMVHKGEVIAEVGSTGRSTGPHLHFEVRVDGKQTDPMKYLK